MSEEKELKTPTFMDAINLLKGDMILCNVIADIDDTLYNDNRYNDLAANSDDVFQYFLTSWSTWDVKFLNRVFDLQFLYSDMLGLWVLAVTHYGTAWDCCPCKCYDEETAKVKGWKYTEDDADEEDDESEEE